MAYYGEYNYTVDQANRLTVPAKFRDAVGGEVVLVRAPEGCLFLYDCASFEEVRKQLDSIADTLEGRLKIRNFYADVVSLTVDRTGRFIIPAEFLSFARLKTDVVILGVGDRMEIWDKTEYVEAFGDRDAISMKDYPSIRY